MISHCCAAALLGSMLSAIPTSVKMLSRNPLAKGFIFKGKELAGFIDAFLKNKGYKGLADH
jgi:ABC-type Fe3+-siderophore transport system permease subunit